MVLCAFCWENVSERRAELHRPPTLEDQVREGTLRERKENGQLGCSLFISQTQWSGTLPCRVLGKRRSQCFLAMESTVQQECT